MSMVIAALIFTAVLTLNTAAAELPCISSVCVGDGIEKVPTAGKDPFGDQRSASEDPEQVVRRLRPIFPGVSEGGLRLLMLYEHLGSVEQFEFSSMIRDFFLKHKKYCDFFDVISEFDSPSGYNTMITMNPLSPSGPVVVTAIDRNYNVPSTEVPAFERRICSTHPAPLHP